MAIGLGSHVGPYEVTALLGEGGMGKVWRAHHSALERDDALKVLPDAFASDPERLARFQREARVVASLNHPNIAHVYGLEQSAPSAGSGQAGVQALVMELVEGPTLADRIGQGPIPIDEALPIARQIAEALEAAHEKGIIHRDLKPANVKVRPDGTVKVLDFGLAKALEPIAAAGLDATASPTITSPAMMTGVGVLLGTAAYMSPEQARGRTVDRRCDIWAFGCVLYEMLTGRRAFEGEDVSATLADVIRAEPAWNQLPDGLSPSLVTFLRRCLRKDPRDRVRDIGDVRLALEGAFDSALTQTAAATVTTPPAMWRRYLTPVLASLVTAAVAALAAWSLWPSTEPPLVSRFDVVLPQGRPFRGTGRPVMAVSPDGRSFVYNAMGGLYVRTMGELAARLVPGTEGTLTNPTFSPDGQSIAYYQESQLKRIAISGGAPVVISPATNPFGVSWEADNAILFGQPEGIMRVSANGGTPELVIRAEKGEQMHGPQALPDGESVLFSVTGARGTTRWDQADIVVQSLRTSQRTVRTERGQ